MEAEGSIPRSHIAELIAGETVARRFGASPGRTPQRGSDQAFEKDRGCAPTQYSAGGATVTSTGNQALDALADAIADRVYRRIATTLQRDKRRLLDVADAAEYLGRSASALRHLIAKGAIPCIRRDGRVQLDRQDLDNWLELGKTRS